jgi:hypothetical protein
MGIKAKTQIAQHQVHCQKTQQQQQQHQEMLINTFKETNFNGHSNLNKKHANGFLSENKNLGKLGVLKKLIR